MLKICEQKGVGDVYTVDQFYNLSQLAIDEVKQVRELFVAKLHKVWNIGSGEEKHLIFDNDAQFAAT